VRQCFGDCATHSDGHAHSQAPARAPRNPQDAYGTPYPHRDDHSDRDRDNRHDPHADAASHTYYPELVPVARLTRIARVPRLSFLTRLGIRWRAFLARVALLSFLACLRLLSPTQAAQPASSA
jgi:hypothetical protein